MNTLHTIILGLVEGFTEFLPISSTAHLTLAGKLMAIPETDFFKTFIIFIQLGAIIPVLYIYLRKYAANMEVHKRVAVAFLPTALIGFVLYKLIKQYFLGNITLLLWTLGVGGAVLILFEFFYKPKEELGSIEQISYTKAATIGLVQSLAVVPGVSRSGASILAGLAMGIPRATIVEFSFLLAVPTMLAASGYDLYKNYSLFATADWKLLAIGFVASFLSALVSIKLFLALVRRYNFTYFGVYRIVIALVFALLFLK